MPLKYNVIEIFTSEETRYKGKPVHKCIIDHVRKAKIAARCIVHKGIAGCYENGESASRNIEILSFNMPLKIEIILPSGELAVVLPGIEEIVTDGIVVVEDMDIRCHKVQSRLMPRQLKVKDVMTVNPVCVDKYKNAADVIKIILNARFNAVPVVDENLKPLGIITQGDLILRANMPVRLGLLSRIEQKKSNAYLSSVPLKNVTEIMTAPAVVIHQDKPLGEAVDSMLEHGLKRLPTVDDDGRVTGILARYDVFRTISNENPDYESFKSKNVRVANIHHVNDILQRDMHTVSPDTAILEIIRLFKAHTIQRVSVVDNNGKFIGLISDRDIIGVFAEHQAGVWDYLMAKMPFHELSEKHKELIRQTKMKVASDVMKTGIMTVTENTPIDDAIKKMVQYSFKRLPVIDDNGIFKGMISRDSVLRAGARI